MRTRNKVAVVVCGVVIAASVTIVAHEIVSAHSWLGPFVRPLMAPRSDRLSYEVYVPPGLDRSRRHPLVFGGSPRGAGHDLLPVWKDVCDRLGWILLMTDNFRNGPRDDEDAAFELEALARALRDYPIDPARIYATGISGAGMHAHDLVGDHPDLFRGVVVNTGMMPHHMPGNDPFDAAHYPRSKLAVFLASPTDFRYREMQEDRALLETVGWQTAWFEFDAGHSYAPPDVYQQAAAWLAAH